MQQSPGRSRSFTLRKDRAAAGAFEVVDEGAGIVRVDVRTSLVRKEFAEALCADIERAAARYPGKAKLLMDMGALSKATPPAGYHAMRRMKELDFSRIALVGGNRFMRSFAQVVMTLARFGSFAFFGERRSARDWLERS